MGQNLYLKSKLSLALRHSTSVARRICMDELKEITQKESVPTKMPEFISAVNLHLLTFLSIFSISSCFFLYVFVNPLLLF
ncbi:hypothetical protein MA16_Dca005874 [Dendrobium catenatum]|uniref:Uncharacterized protein n=1 Tax=Dendrobium catenatum TaxID=906689 RepID=A0A2I0WXF5_9ASPA|nr:hypothetical protein MA16_Dca005874 [Dendrobium catenatum]